MNICKCSPKGSFLTLVFMVIKTVAPKDVGTGFSTVNPS